MQSQWNINQRSSVLLLPLSLQASSSSSIIHHQWKDDICRRQLTTTPPPPPTEPDNRPDTAMVSSFVGHNFPDFIEHWSRDAFYKVGYGLGASTGGLAMLCVVFGPTTTFVIPTAILGLTTAAYWKRGKDDMAQTSHAIRRNYPVLGNVRYMLETVRPEIRQYLVESDVDGKPYERNRRSIIYQRAKNVDDTMAFGTRRDVYATNYEWACHSMWPKSIAAESDATRCTIGTASFGTTQPYSASVLNISAMSYGAISDNAILALSRGAKLGGFYHNTGEGGVSKSHKEGGGDIVWNVGTGYFGCGITDPATGRRVFDADIFQETIREAMGQIKMVEIKLSQGAKPGHGGILPKAKITPAIAEARKLEYPAKGDCHSPPGHSAFDSPEALVKFIIQLRELSGGLPVGIKMCVGEPSEVAALVKTMVLLQNGPDFISVDGGEGGTGAAPPEYSDSIGLPLEEGLAVVRNLLVGADMKDKVKLNCSGRVTNGFSVVRMVALGADITCAARAFMMSLGCIQALKCNTNRCPTGIATQDKELQYGLDPLEKTNRVYHYHRKTVLSASEIVGTIGRESFDEISSGDIMRRVRQGKVQTLSEYLPEVETGCLLNGSGPERLQEVWDSVDGGADSTAVVGAVMDIRRTSTTKRWIY
ncbi:unnamed protein product [Cylindrotheca closterium]|uniref:Glutamate synthase domain-containing protein n=1 Tax=Cylindrotheca closterium TaxID=2856 RepID=A0AAD2GB45_9STRA|nr:unnamed protein product [Cylindrotheca closterium]